MTRQHTRKAVLSITITLCALWIGGCATQQAASRTDHGRTGTPLPVDPQVQISTLDNGLTVWIKHHETPPDQVGMWLHIGTGSLNETDEQRGLAHYLEHLAFNGTENFPPGTLIKYFESIGLTFGHHQNAFTSYDQTVYQITLPNTEPDTISKGLLCLADYAHRMLLTEEEIEKERGVILEEMRARKGAGQRVWEKVLPIMLPDSRVAERRPIGEEEVVREVERPDFTDYYTHWYRPETSTLIVVGDVEPTRMLELVKAQFSSWRPKTERRESVDPAVRPYERVRAAVVTDPELTEVEASVMSLRPLEPLDTVEDLRRDMVTGLGLWIIDRRLSDMVQAGKAPFQSADFYSGPFINVATYVGADAQGTPEKWQPILTSLLVELKRAREYGVLPGELDTARKALLARLEQAAATESTRDMRGVLSGLNATVARHRKPLSAAQELELARELLPGIDLREVNDAISRCFTADRRLVLLTMPEKEGLDVPGEQDLLGIARRVEATPVDPPAEKAMAESLMEQLPVAGSITESSEDSDLGVLSATLSNGVRIHLRTMDAKKDTVFVQLTIGGGRVRETAENRGITDAAVLAWQRKATRDLSSTEVRDLMTGVKVTVGGSAAGDHVKLSVTGNPADLEKGLQLAHLLLTRPRIETAALAQWKEMMAQAIQEQEKSVETQVAVGQDRLLSGGDIRLAPLTLEQVAAVELESAQEWLDRIIAEGPVEVAIVGDMPRERMEELALTYFGSLPARPREDAELEELRQVTVKEGPLTDTVQVDTITPRAVVRLGWRGPNWLEQMERRTLSIASRILQPRLRKAIREDRGLTYSIFCFSRPGTEFKDVGFLAVHFTADPDKAEEAAAIARDVVEEFAKAGPTDEEMETVRKQFKNIVETSQKEPSYWSDVMSDLDLHGASLQDVKTALEAYTTYTREQVAATVRNYVVEAGRYRVIALPAQPTAPDAAEETETEN